MEQACKTCKHWEDIWSMYPRPMTSGMCALTQTESNHESQTETWAPAHPESKAHVIWPFPDDDGTFVRAMLVTEPDFSCNQWEPCR